ncbi:mucin-3B-like isoform X1 [Acipenser ruthenus]|uniref:mucin-3B-like isoform X1 n=1 Tax=Acipenser ruthenus TaxID=7906 RepID=UPI0027426AD6|nr:mucin-3B-like isoform X1 [Acipenser ruthenus]
MPSTHGATTPEVSSTPHSTAETASQSTSMSHPVTLVPLSTSSTDAAHKTPFTSTSASTAGTLTTAAPSTTTVTQATTKKLCSESDCDCNGAPCVYNETSGQCQCNCLEFTEGKNCINGQNETTVVIDKKTVPTRNVSVSLSINKSFNSSLTDPSSDLYQQYVRMIKPELERLCRQASPQNFKQVIITGFRNGSIVTESLVTYNYPNQDSEIQYLNNQLVAVLNSILNDTTNLRNLSAAVNAPVNLLNTTGETPAITNITELKPFVDKCSLNYANYTIEVVNESLTCVGPCGRIADYCSYKGSCYNRPQGPVCTCFVSDFQQYTGTHCELYQRTAGFYGVLFGVLGAALLLLIVLIVAVIILARKRKEPWNSNALHPRRWFSLDEEYFNFSHTDLGTTASASEGVSGRSGRYNMGDNLMFSNEFTPGVFKPNLENVDTSLDVRTKRPELTPSSDQ